MNKRLYSLFLFLTIVLKVSAQSDSLVNRDVRALENYATNKPIEKVHLHLDRQVYFPGDTIWFKAYVVLGQEHQLSALSGILYAELISPKDSVEKRLTLKIEDGTSHAEFALPYDMKPGTYRMRAYTNWMRNFGSEYFFDQPVTVASFSLPVVPAQATASKVSESHIPDKVDLQFFPEGGDLVNGLRSKLAFKAINQNGMAEEVQGSILDNGGNEVATFTSQHLGMGAFPLEPQKGKQYFAKVTAADGSTMSMPLPTAKDAGFTLSVNNQAGDSLYVKVAAVNVPDTAFYLIAQSGGKTFFAGTHKLQDKVYTESLAKSRFPTGIVQFTLFAQSGEPLNERIVFIQNDDQLKLTLTTDKQTYAPGEQVKLSLEAKNQRGEPVAGTFSVAVIDESAVPVNEAAENTIFTDLLLKSELAGYIENPNYYFINPNDQTNADLDLLMLTQGYHRFEWKKILSKDDQSFAYQLEKGFTLSGTVTTQTGKPVPNGKVVLSSIKNKLALDTLTDEHGKFAFNNIMLPDTATLVVNAKKANGGNNVVLTMDKPVYAAVSKMDTVTDYIAHHFNGQVQPDPAQIKLAYTAWQQDSLGHVIQLKEVTVKDHKIPPIHPDYSKVLKYSANLNGPGQANQVIVGSDLTSYPSIIGSLKMHLSGGVIWHGDAIFSSHTPIELTGPTQPMAVLLDGVITDQKELSTISPSEVQGIEMLESPYYYSIYGSVARGGIIIVTLKHGVEDGYIFPVQTGLTLYRSPGFYKSREFYIPKYTPNQTVTLVNNGPTIFWANALQIDENKTQTTIFLNATDIGDYVITIEGIDDNGRLGRKLLRYKVERNN